MSKKCPECGLCTMLRHPESKFIAQLVDTRKPPETLKCNCCGYTETDEEDCGFCPFCDSSDTEIADSGYLYLCRECGHEWDD